MNKKFFSDNNILIALFSLEILALTMRDNVEAVFLFLIIQLFIYLLKIQSNISLLKMDKQLELPHIEPHQVLVHSFNHYILPLTQIVTVNLFLLTYESYHTYLIQIALNILLLSIVMKNTEAYLRNKYIIEAQTHYIYDVVSTFILFNAFWGGSIYLGTVTSQNGVYIILFTLYMISLVLTLLRYHFDHFNKWSLIFVLFNLTFFIAGAILFGIQIKFVLTISYGYYLSLSLLHHILNRDFKWGLILEYAILTGIILVLMY